MAKACKCDVGLSNTGTACTPIQSVAQKVIFVPYYKEDGTQNQIDTTATLDSAYFTALINNVESYERWYPLPSLKNVVDERGDDIREAFDDGTEAFIGEGARKFEGILVGGAPQLLGKIKDMRCVPVGVYIIDKQRNLIGVENTAGYLDPIRVDENTISAILMKTTDKTVQKIKLSFNFHVEEADEDLRLITNDEMSVNLLTLQGLLDITSEYTNVTSTSLKVTLFTEYGTPINPVMDKGLVVTDFVSSVTGTASRIRNSSTGADVTLTGCTESPDGTYTLTYSSGVSVGNVLIIKPKKNGRDYTEVEANTTTCATT